MKKIEVIVKATMIQDDEGNYTIFDLNSKKGGAIISDLDPFIAMSNFKEATHLAFAVMNLLALRNGDRNWKIPIFE